MENSPYPPMPASWSGRKPLAYPPTLADVALAVRYQQVELAKSNQDGGKDLGQATVLAHVVTDHYKTLNPVGSATTTNGPTNFTAQQLEQLSSLILLSLEPVKTDLAAVKTDLAAVKTDLAAVKTDLAAVKTDLAAVKTDLAAVKTTVGQLSGGLYGLAHTVHTNLNHGCSDGHKPFVEVQNQAFTTPSQVGLEALRTSAQIADMDAARVRMYLKHYRLPATGSVAQLRERLRVHIGCEAPLS